MKSQYLQDTALRYFLEVVRCGSIAAASQRLNVASSAISRQISNLESLLDTVLFEPRALRFLCDTVGADKIMLGSDYPFGIGDPDPRNVVDHTPLTAEERDAILGGNAARIFHIDCGCGQGG